MSVFGAATVIGVTALAINVAGPIQGKSESEQIADINACADNLVEGDFAYVPDYCGDYSFNYDTVTVTKYKPDNGSSVTDTKTIYHMPSAADFKAEHMPKVVTDKEATRFTRNFYLGIGGFAVFSMTIAAYGLFKPKRKDQETETDNTRQLVEAAE